MPKFKNVINLNLLKSQSDPKKFLTRAVGWLLSAGRYIIIFVEIIVLAAFLARFRLDADLEETRERIEQVTPYLENLHSDEIQIRQTQFQIANIKSFRKVSLDFSFILKETADQMPKGITLTNLNLENAQGKINFQLNGTSRSDLDLTIFVGGLKDQPAFSNVHLTNFGFEEGVINFTISGSYQKREVVI